MCGMSDVEGKKTLDKMQNVGYICHLHLGITRRQAMQYPAANGTTAGDVCECFLEPFGF